MTSHPKKRGRPTAFHRMADGTKIDGLSRTTDGRWKVSPGPGQPTIIKFREADERLAVAKFRELQARSGKLEEVFVAVGTYPTVAEAVVAGLQHQLDAQGQGRHARIKLSAQQGGGGPATVDEARTFDDPVYWRWLHAQFVTRAR